MVATAEMVDRQVAVKGVKEVTAVAPGDLGVTAEMVDMVGVVKIT
jgi:hypothetical protein